MAAQLDSQRAEAENRVRSVSCHREVSHVSICSKLHKPGNQLTDVPLSRIMCTWQGAISRLPAHAQLLDVDVGDRISVLCFGVDIRNLVTRSDDEPVVTGTTG